MEIKPADELAFDNPKYMATEAYAEANGDLIIAYAKMRVHGIHPSVAFRRIFGESMWAMEPQARIYAVESSELYEETFRSLLRNTPVNELWNDKLAINKLLGIANNSFGTDSTRLRAIQELNVLIGIVVVDENGKSKRGSKMGDFYRDIGTEEKRNHKNGS